MLFRPKERAWDREERQDERAARGRRKAERTLVPGQEGREFWSQNRVGTGTALSYSPALDWL